MNCKCIKCDKTETFPSFKNAWMKGWDFIKEIKSKEEIVGVCDECPSLQREEKMELLEKMV